MTESNTNDIPCEKEIKITITPLFDGGPANLDDVVVYAWRKDIPRFLETGELLLVPPSPEGTPLSMGDYLYNISGEPGCRSDSAIAEFDMLPGKPRLVAYYTNVNLDEWYPGDTWTLDSVNETPR